MERHIRYYLIVLGLIFSTSVLAGSTKSDSWFERICAPFANAHSACKSAIVINQSLGTLKSSKIEFLGQSSDGGEVTLYKTDKNVLKKTTIGYHGEMGKEILNFYFQEARIILINRELTLYNQTTASKKTKAQEIERASYVIRANQIVTVLGVTGDSAPTASDKIWAEQAINDMTKKLKGV